MLMCCLSCSKVDSCEQADRVEDYCINHEERHMTNADRIRAMSDVELARWFDQLTNGCNSCPNKHDCTYSIESFGRCDDIWLGWLKQEANE